MNGDGEKLTSIFSVEVQFCILLPELYWKISWMFVQSLPANSQSLLQSWQSVVAAWTLRLLLMVMITVEVRSSDSCELRMGLLLVQDTVRKDSSICPGSQPQLHLGSSEVKQLKRQLQVVAYGTSLACCFESSQRKEEPKPATCQQSSLCVCSSFCSISQGSPNVTLDITGSFVNSG